MREEDIETLDDEGQGLGQENQNDNNSSIKKTSSPLKDAITNIAGATLDSNKYKSKLNHINPNDDNSTTMAKNGFNKTIPSKESNTVNTVKNAVGNKAVNAVSNLHPALKGVNIARNIISGRRSNNSNTSGNNSINNNNSNSPANDNNNTDSNNINTKNNDVMPNNTVNNGIDNSDDNSSSNRGSILNSLNPLSSVLGGTSGVSGRFSFLGKIPVALKFVIIGAVSFFGLLILTLLPALIIISLFSSFFGMDSTITSSGNGSGNIDYGDYELSSDGDEILHQPLSAFLTTNGSSLAEFNNLITTNVEDAGFGTRAGVVASAVTLIAELGNNYDVKVPYYWGGGHGNIANGALGNWGSSECHTYANGQSYNYCGLDCSGFVTWAIYNGGFNMSPRTAGTFQYLPGAERVTLSSSGVLQPGDLMESDHHIVLIVEVVDEGYVCAEAAGNSTGVKFSIRSFNASGYWGVNMDGFYERQARS